MLDRSNYVNASAYIRDTLLRRKRRRRLILITILACIAAAIIFFCEYFRVRHVTVEGSTHYTDEEIEGYVMNGFLGDNSVVLSWRYRDRKLQNIPFIESMDVEVIRRDTIHITVYEKSIAGYVSYLGRNFYFDRNGMVVESSTDQLEGIPEVTGLQFDSIAMNQVLPVADTGIFARILEVSQLLGQYDLTADRIDVAASGALSVYFGNVRASLGQDEYMNEKISNLADILPSLTGKSGTLDLSNYEPDTNYVTFSENNG